MNNEIQRRQEKKKTDRETYSERVKEKLGGGSRQKMKQRISTIHSKETESTSGTFVLRKRDDKMMRSSAPSCGSQQNSLTETLNGYYDQRIQGDAYLMTHCCALLAMKLLSF